MNFQTYPFSQRSIATILPPPTQILYAIATKQYVLPTTKIEQLAIMTLQTSIPERNNAIPIVQNEVEQCNERDVVGDAGEKLEEPALELLILPEEGTQEVFLPDEEAPIMEGTMEEQVETPFISSEIDEIRKKASKLRRIKVKGLRWMGKTFKRGRVVKV